MEITVILCTYNRCQSLVKALDSATELKLPESVEWEVLVVDNNSADQTREVVEDFCRRHPGRFRYLFEPQPGKSHGLNAGIREARGDVLAFMDDDVTVGPMWLKSLTAALHNGQWAGAGGRILPQRDFTRPRWLSLEGRHTSAPLALFDRGLEAGELAEAPVGTNMAFRKEMFAKYGGFRIDLGPRPGARNPQDGGEQRLGGGAEDSEFGHRLLAAGERLRYEPSAVVYHEVPERRLQKEYLLDWWFAKARADIRAFAIPGRPKWRFSGIPLVLFRRLAVWTLRWLVSIEPSRRFTNKLNTWTVAGQILECYRLSLDSRKSR